MEVSINKARPRARTKTELLSFIQQNKKMRLTCRSCVWSNQQVAGDMIYCMFPRCFKEVLSKDKLLCKKKGEEL